MAHQIIISITDNGNGTDCTMNINATGKIPQKMWDRMDKTIHTNLRQLLSLGRGRFTHAIEVKSFKSK